MGGNTLVKKIKLLCATVIIFLSLPIAAQALGMGVPVLKSHLNEILDVRVPLLLSKGESLNSLFIEFAKPDEYRLVGLEPYTDLSGLRVSVEHMQHGELYISLSSVSAVQTPIVSLLLKARIGHNTYYKQVQLLLDTMGLGARTHAIKARPKDISPRLNDGAKNPTSGVETGQGWARTWRYGPVRSGDSLSTIAYRLRRDKQWSNHDVMLALYRFNPNAFIEHDMNRLKSGVWLEIPRGKVLKELLKQAPEPYEKFKQKTRSVPKKPPKPTLVSETEVKKNNPASQLRYVGRIALGNDKAPAVAVKISPSKDSVQLQRQLDQLYQQAMDDHLQMANLDQNIMAIRDDIGKLSSDIIALKEQQNIMQKQMLSSPKTQYWMQGFLLLCLLNIILIGVFLYRKYRMEKKERYDIEKVYFNKKHEKDTHIEEPKAILIKKDEGKKNTLENKIFDIENYLNLRDYDAVEDILKKLSQSEDEHFGVCALKVRLYHETARLDERDTFIQNKKDMLNSQQWDLLCDRLPLNIWHALHESGVIRDHGPLLDIEGKPDDTSDNKDTLDVDLEKTVMAPIVFGGNSGQASENKDALEIDLKDTLIAPITFEENSGHARENESFLEVDLKDALIAPIVFKEKSEHTSDHEDVSEVDVLSEAEFTTVNLEDANVLSPPALEVNQDILKLNDVEVEDVDKHAVAEPDEFVSTVFMKTKDGKTDIL